MVRRALVDSVIKLSPRHMKANPVMFVVEIGSVLTTFYLIRDFGTASSSEKRLRPRCGHLAVVHRALRHFAEAIAEGRGKAQADTLRKTRAETVAYVQRGDDIVEVASSQAATPATCAW